METINAKINELLQVSAENFDHLLGVKGGNWSERFDAKMKKQEELMNELDVLAKAQKTILGRTVRFPMADSYALYLVTSVGKTQVQIKWLNYCDAWVDDRAGYACKLDRKYAEQHIYGRDRLDELFSKKKIENESK